MSDAEEATPSALLREQLMDPRVPKSEREWWAARTIEAFEAEVERLTLELEAKHRAWNHAVEEGARLGRERDEARALADAHYDALTTCADSHEEQRKELVKARAERDGLAKALRIIRDARARSATDRDAVGEVERLADTALAALPPKPTAEDKAWLDDSATDLARVLTEHEGTAPKEDDR